MSFFRQADIPRMYAHLGDVDVTFGATTIRGARTIADESLLQGQAADFIANAITVEVETEALPGLAEGLAITIDGIACQILRVQQTDDGALTLVQAARA